MAALVAVTIAANDALPTDAEIAKMRVKQLKILLKERGVECKGCAEKADLVRRVQETIKMPKVEQVDAPPRSEPGASSAGPEKFDQESIMKAFKRQQEQQAALRFLVALSVFGQTNGDDVT